jgi:lactoylglutathione lyase
MATAENDFELELTINKGRAEPYELGNGYGHLAVVVDDVEAEHTRFSAEGLTVGKLVDFKNGDMPVAKFFFATDPDGYKIEVIQKGGRFK